MDTIVALILSFLKAGIIVYLVVKVISGSLSFGGISAKLQAGARSLSQSLGQTAKGRYEKTQYAQRRQLAKASREATRNRAGQSSYANLITQDSWRGNRLRRRAAGRDADAQKRALASGIGSLESLERDEVKAASRVIDFRDVTNSESLREIAAGRSGGGINGKGDKAMQLAAIDKLLTQEDAEQIENLFKDAGTNHSLLVAELKRTENFPKTKTTGAHLVAMEPRIYSNDEVQKSAMTALSDLSEEKLAGQDKGSIASATQAYLTGQGSAADRVKFYEKVQSLARDQKNYNRLRQQSKDNVVAILNTQPPYGPHPTPPPNPNTNPPVPPNP